MTAHTPNPMFGPPFLARPDPERMRVAAEEFSDGEADAPPATPLDS